MKGQQVAYIRVSSYNQNTERQLVDIEFDKIFEEKKSGKDLERPQLQACLKHLRAGDTLHCHSIDRLARNLLDLQKIISELVGMGVTVQFHKEGLVFSGGANPMQELMMQLLGAFAQFERSIIRDRQLEGIENAQKNGVKFGAPNKLTPERIAELRVRAAEPGVDKKALAAEFGVSRPTLYAALR